MWNCFNSFCVIHECILSLCRSAKICESRRKFVITVAVMHFLEIAVSVLGYNLPKLRCRFLLKTVL